MVGFFELFHPHCLDEFLVDLWFDGVYFVHFFCLLASFVVVLTVHRFDVIVLWK